MKSSEDLHFLFKKYLNHECTTSEIRFLLSKFGEAESEEALKEAIKQYFNELQEAEGNNEAFIQSAVDEVHTNLIKQIKASPQINKPVYRLMWLRAAAAVLILGTLTTGIYIYNNNHHQRQQTNKIAVSEIKNDVLPGTNKAILTLGNGSKILLNDVKNGIIARQGTITVTKTKEGQIINSANSSPAKNTVAAPDYNTITTPRGGQYQVILPDGSKVWLNAESSLKYPTIFTGGERDVELKGEAYFEVAKNAAMPFKVIAEGQIVKVLGTHFNINAYTDEKVIKTTLLEGSIQITYHNAAAMIKPGEQAQVALGSANKIAVNVDDDVDEAVAWKDGYMQFNHADIQTVMRQIARWYDVSVQYEGQSTSKQYGGAIQRNLKLSQVLKFLENNHLHFKLEGKEVTVMP